MSNSTLSVDVFKTYQGLPTPSDRLQAEYIWIGGNTTSGLDIRSKTKTIHKEYIQSLDDLPVWNYDGSSTGQAPGDDSEVYLKPVKFYPDPFRGGRNVLVLCESCLPDGNLTPIPTNMRREAARLFDRAPEEQAWFGIEQEYTLLHDDGRTPLGWPVGGFPRPQGPFYCSAGTENAHGRRVADAHYRACLSAGLNVSGINAEVMPGQWEYQVGPCTGIDAGDQLVLSRYILLRVCEDFGVVVTLDPKPMPGDWNGAGAHCNFSTHSMRDEGGYAKIVEAIERLGTKHGEHMACYGSGNERRLTGNHETAPIDRFSYGVADRGASVRIPRTTHLDQKGYFEDRRPASNVCPYTLTGKLFKTCVLDTKVD